MRHGTAPAGDLPSSGLDDQHGNAGLRDELHTSTLGPLRAEGELPSFEGATGWLNSEPLTMADLAGKVVLVQFWTFSCINWLRTLPYVSAWAERYRDHGLVVIGAHTPEFRFEQDIENVRRAASGLKVDYPIALDPNYAVWRAFDNNYWPALYFVDAEGQIRHHHFGEGDYEQSERVIQRLLADAGAAKIGEELVAVDPQGIEAAADWENLGTPETYVGYARGENLASPGGVLPDARRTYDAPPELRLNRWALSGEWAIQSQAAVSGSENAKVVFRFRARDLNLVMGIPGTPEPAAFRVLLDGAPPGAAHGLDVDADGRGVLAEQRVYQLVRQPGRVGERTFEITFAEPGAHAYVFTFG